MAAVDGWADEDDEATAAATAFGAEDEVLGGMAVGDWKMGVVLGWDSIVADAAAGSFWARRDGEANIGQEGGRGPVGGPTKL